ncbi:hypothetical protein, partial [Vibrio metschnikovii]|uniref:hypothetical protein n=1 Tax=Vibrio metschnikovii TaxID=28172 RepID=UPI002FCC9DCE
VNLPAPPSMVRIRPPPPYRLSLLREQAFLYLQSILSPLAGRLSDNKKGFTLLNVKPNIES